MGKKLKPGTVGNAVQYLTRNQALKKLQLKLSDFRRLCIVKGIHPREPRKKLKGSDKTYYHLKDIMFLAHEPLLKKFRLLAIHRRKIRRAKAKLNNDLAKRLTEQTPTVKMDHLVKERYPSFVDAIRDLDDTLTMIHLFATLPAEQRYRIPTSAVQISRRLALEWQAFIVRTNSLRKVFISVKGFYFQAEVIGQPVTWLVPHQLSQVLPIDVDYRVMLTFLEFYQTLLQFVNFKLYHLIGVSYPPVVDPKMEQAAAGLEAIMRDLAETQTMSKKAPSATGACGAGAKVELDAMASKRLETLQEKLEELQQQNQVPRLEAGSTKMSRPTAEEPTAETSSDSDEEMGGRSSGPESKTGKEKRISADPVTDLGSADLAEPGLEAQLAQEDPEAEDVAAEGEDDAEVCATLFKGLVFYMGREIPRELLLVVVRAFGGQVGWDGEESPIQEDDPVITHQVVDRPEQKQKREGREYIQPQWIVDSANFRVLADARLYAPGAAPPPHLSPFVDSDEEGYVPEYAAVLLKMQESARAARQQAKGIAQGAAFIEEDSKIEGSKLSEADEIAAAEELYKTELEKELGAKPNSKEELRDLSGEEEEAPTDATEPKNVTVDEASMNKAVMKRKDRHLYQSILNRQAAKKQRVSKLQKKRAALK